MADSQYNSENVRNAAEWLGAEPIIPVMRDFRVEAVIRVSRDFVARGAKRILGHKSIKNTLKYIQLSNAIFDENADQYICKVARSLQDATELVELGFDYVTEMDGVKLFRKPA